MPPAKYIGKTVQPTNKSGFITLRNMNTAVSFVNILMNDHAGAFNIDSGSGEKEAIYLENLQKCYGLF